MDTQGMMSERNMLLSSIVTAISLVLKLGNGLAFHITINGHSLLLKLNNGLTFHIYHRSGLKYTLHTVYMHRKYCNITYVSEGNLKSTRMLTISLFDGEKEAAEVQFSSAAAEGNVSNGPVQFQPTVS